MPNGNGNGNGGGGGWSPPLPPDFPYGKCGNICGEYDFNGEIYVDRGSPFYESLNSLCSSSEYGGIILPYLFGWYGISLQGDCGTNYETSTYEVVCPNSNGDFTVPTSACVNYLCNGEVVNGNYYPPPSPYESIVQPDMSCAGTGCTEIDACNYDASATVNDGSCVYPEGTCDCVGDPLPTFCDCDGNVFDALGECGGPCESDADGDGICDDIDECVGEYDQCGVCNGPGLGFGEYYTCWDGIEVCEESDCAEQFDIIEGCTYPDASNYDELANTDDGSCVFGPETVGCLDETAFTFDPSHTYSSETYCHYIADNPEATIHKSTGDNLSGQIFFRLDLFTMLPYINNMIDFSSGYQVHICIPYDEECYQMQLPNETAFNEPSPTPYRSYLWYLSEERGRNSTIRYYYKIVRPDGIEISETNIRKIFFPGVYPGKEHVPAVDYFYNYKKSYEGPADYDNSSHYGYLCTEDSTSQYCKEKIPNSTVEGDSYFIDNPRTVDKVSTYLPIIKHTGNMSSGSLQVQYNGPTLSNKLFNSLNDTPTEKLNLTNITTFDENLEFNITKHSYDLTLEPDNDFSLFGLPSISSWTLDPIIEDFSLIKNQLAREMFFDMGYNVNSGELVHFYQDFFFDNTSNLITSDASGRYTQNYVGYDTEIGCNGIEQRTDYQDAAFSDWSDASLGVQPCNSTLNLPLNPRYSYRAVCDVAPPGVSQTVLVWDARNVFYDHNLNGPGEGGFNITGAISYFDNGTDACNSLDLDTSYLGGVFQETYEGVYYLRGQDVSVNISSFVETGGLNPDAPATLLINEFATKGATDSTGVDILGDMDFIEIFNNSSETIDLKDYKLADRNWLKRCVIEEYTDFTSCEDNSNEDGIGYEWDQDEDECLDVEGSCTEWVQLTTSYEIPSGGFVVIMADSCDDDNPFNDGLGSHCCDSTNDPTGCISHGVNQDDEIAGIQINGPDWTNSPNIYGQEVIRVEWKLGGNDMIYIIDASDDSVVDYIDYRGTQAHDGGEHPCPSNWSFARITDGQGDSGEIITTDVVPEGGGSEVPTATLNGWECREGDDILPGLSNGTPESSIEILDVLSAIDAFLLSELSLNPKTLFYSNYFDFNYSFQIPSDIELYELECNEELIYSDNRLIGDHVSYWLFKNQTSDWRDITFQGNDGKSFLEILMTESNVYISLIERYNELRAPGQVFDIDNIISKINVKQQQLQNDFFYNFDRWNSFSEIFRTEEIIEYYFQHDSLPDINVPTTYNEEIEYLKQWIESRILWMDHNIRNMKKEFYIGGENSCGANVDFVPSYCNDSIAINYNEDSNFNDGSCEYTFNPMYTFNVSYEDVNFPEVLEMKLVIVNLITDEENVYNMNKSGDIYTIDIFDLEIGDFFEYYYIKYIKNISGLFTGSFEEDKPKQFYIYDEQRMTFDNIFNDFELDFEESTLPIVIIDTTRNDCQTDNQYYNGDPGFMPGTPSTSEEDGLCGFGWYYCPAPYAENELYYFNEIIYKGSFKSGQLFDNFCFYINEENCNDEPTCLWEISSDTCKGICGTGEQYIYPCEDSDDIWADYNHPDFYKHRYYENMTDCNATCYVDCIDGETYQDEPKITAHMKILYNGEGIVNNINDESQSEHKIGIEVRGFSHRGFAKKQFAIELQSGAIPRPQVDDAELAYSLFCNGFNPEPEVDYEDCYFRLAEDFVVLGPYRDKTMMKNTLSYELWRKAGEGQRDGKNRPSIKTKYVELVINGSYKGIYIFMDKPEKGNNNRINIEGEEKDSEIVIKVESGAEHGIQSLLLGIDGKTKYEYYEPDYKDHELTPLMKNSIKSIIHTAERSLLECRLITNDSECNIDEKCIWDENLSICNTDLIDINGFIDYYHLEDFALNREGFSRSQYWYFDICPDIENSKCLDDNDSDYENYADISKIYMGPTWDFNHAYGSFDSEYEGTTLSEYTFGQPGFWIDFLCMYGYWPAGTPFGFESYSNGACADGVTNDNENLDYIGKRWGELRQNILSLKEVTSYIDDNYNFFRINKSVDRDFLRWYRFGRNYDKEIIYFKEWIINRLRERDNNYNLTKDFYWTIYPINNQEFDVDTTDEIEIAYQTNLSEPIYSIKIIDSLNGKTIQEFFDLDSSIRFSKSFIFDLRNQAKEDIVGEYQIVLSSYEDDDILVDNNIINFRITNVAKYEGCTDVTALNFDIYSELDDGSCLYREDIVDTVIASTTLNVYRGVNTISYPRENIRLDYNLFQVLNEGYEYDGCEEKPCFNEYDTLIILNGQKDDESDENITAVFINGEWITSGDYGIDIDRYIKIGDGIILHVQQDGVINL